MESESGQLIRLGPQMWKEDDRLHGGVDHLHEEEDGHLHEGKGDYPQRVEIRYDSSTPRVIKGELQDIKQVCQIHVNIVLYWGTPLITMQHTQGFTWRRWLELHL